MTSGVRIPKLGKKWLNQNSRQNGRGMELPVLSAVEASLPTNEGQF